MNSSMKIKWKNKQLLRGFEGAAARSLESCRPVLRWPNGIGDQWRLAGFLALSATAGLRTLHTQIKAESQIKA